MKKETEEREITKAKGRLWPTHQPKFTAHRLFSKRISTNGKRRKKHLHNQLHKKEPNILSQTYKPKPD
jgi:hypothetical protein